jgi:16S rRNA (guanine966-N2)-methyltransferase
LRIVEGKWAGRHLTSPGKRVRATAEGVRIAWISSFEPELRGARVLELFAGSGAVGLETLSRGAGSVDFVESGAQSLHALKANVAALRAHDLTRIFKKDVVPFLERLVAQHPGEVLYDLVLADPPYHSRALDRVIELWKNSPFSRILSVEHHEEHLLPRGGKRIFLAETICVTNYRGRGSAVKRTQEAGAP